MGKGASTERVVREIQRPIHEEEAVAGERILAEARHQAAQALEALPQIGRRRVRPHAEAPRAADHPSARSSAVAVGRSSPSTR